MTPPAWFVEHPVISLEWTASILQALEAEPRDKVLWRLTTYEYERGKSLTVTPELRIFVLAQQISGLYDFYRSYIPVVVSETSEFKAKVDQASNNCRDLFETLTNDEPDGKRSFDEQFSTLMLEVFPPTETRPSGEHLNDFLFRLGVLNDALWRKREAFEVLGTGGGDQQRMKKIIRQQVLRLFQSCWEVQKPKGGASEADIPGVFVRFAKRVLFAITSLEEEIDTLRRAYQEMGEDRSAVRSAHAGQSLDRLREVARSISRNSKPLGA